MVGNAALLPTLPDYLTDANRPDSGGYDVVVHNGSAHYVA